MLNLKNNLSKHGWEWLYISLFMKILFLKKSFIMIPDVKCIYYFESMSVIWDELEKERKTTFPFSVKHLLSLKSWIIEWRWCYCLLRVWVIKHQTLLLWWRITCVTTNNTVVICPCFLPVTVFVLITGILIIVSLIFIWSIVDYLITGSVALRTKNQHYCLLIFSIGLYMHLVYSESVQRHQRSLHTS